MWMFIRHGDVWQTNYRARMAALMTESVKRRSGVCASVCLISALGGLIVQLEQANHFSLAITLEFGGTKICTFYMGAIEIPVTVWC